MNSKKNKVSIPDIIKAPRTDKIYNCHSYLTKVPVDAISPFLEYFTKKDETVVDPFAGSGMTGIAAAMHGRKAIISDLSVLGQHIGKGYLTEVDPINFQRESERVIKEARVAIKDLYMTKRQSDGTLVEMVRAVWSFTYVCPECQTPLVYYKHLRNEGTQQPDECKKCKTKFVRRSWPKDKDVLVEVVVRNESGRITEQEPGKSDFESVKSALGDARQNEIPSLPIEENREMYRRSALGKHGFTETKLFFSPRNAIALLELWKAIGDVKNSALRKKLSFCFTAILPRASKRYQWGPKRPLNAQNQTYYIAPVYYEWNVFELFSRKINAALRSDEELFNKTPLFTSNISKNVDYKISSADALAHLEDNSVDYVFTDPPFGSNIFYSDMNLFQEAWLGKNTKHAKEAVMHTTGKKKNGASERYESILKGAFAEAFRILKPGKYMSVVFGNSNGAIWSLVQNALCDAGFGMVPTHVAILDKGQRSVKGLNSGSEGVVTVDLVVTVQKPLKEKTILAKKAVHGNAKELLDIAINKLDSEKANNPSYVYVAIIKEAIERHQLVDKLHLSDVLVALRNRGYAINPKTGLLMSPENNCDTRSRMAS